MNKLIIWDFDGVIADSEKLWVSVWLETLQKEKNISLSEDEKLNLLVGIADKNKKINLEKYFSNLTLDDDFMQKIDAGEKYKGMHFMQPIDGVEDVMSDNRFAHCIATGATKEQHAWKMTQFKWIERYMSPNDYFTVDMVKQGKPEPDIFLLAAETKGYKPQNCIVIGDSLNDFKAASAAGMKSIAFVGAEGNNTPEYRQKCIDTGVVAVCASMKEVKQVLNNFATEINLFNAKDSYSR
ncbi:MAG: HAD family phosphatase [Alphaproteobacteria bacterium]|nr:HAD family phosphatase [Alphaproteobacteria bacterium]